MKKQQKITLLLMLTVLGFTVTGICQQWSLSEDFKVSDNIADMEEDYNPRIAMNAAGQAMIIWYQEAKPDVISGQILNADGSLRGENLQLLNTSAYQYDVGIDGDGNSVFVYPGGTSKSYTICYRAFDADGKLLRENIQVNQEYLNDNFYPPLRIAVNENGRYVIVWNNRGPDRKDIFAQIYMGDGTPVQGNLNLTNSPQSSEYYPEVAIDENGNFAVAWYENFGSTMKIYAQKFNAIGIPVSSPVLVAEWSQRLNVTVLDLSMNASGDFLVVWEQTVASAYKILGQRFAANGTKTGEPFEVRTSSTSRLEAKLFDNGTFVVVWSGNLFQRFAADATPLGIVSPNISVDGQASCSAIAGNSDNEFTIAWEHEYNGEHGEAIYAQRYHSDGSPDGVNFIISRSEKAGVAQTAVALDVNSSGKMVFAWDDYRFKSHSYPDPDIFGQTLDGKGNFIGDNYPVKTEHYTEKNPDVALFDDGSYLIVWLDDNHSEAEEYNLYARYYNPQGMFRKEFRINDGADGKHGPVTDDPPDVATNPNGGFIAVWGDRREDWRDTHIYAQRCDNNLKKIGASFMINDAVPERSDCEYPSLGIDDDGDFVVVWQDNRDGDFNIYGQRFDDAGGRRRNNFKINDDDGKTNQDEPVVAVNAAGKFIVTWVDKRNGQNEIYAQRFSAAGARFGDNFKVSNSSGSCASPAITITDTDEFVIVWQDFRNGNWDIYAQKYDAEGNPIRKNYRVDEAPDASAQEQPKVVFKNGRLHFAWQDKRNPGENYDIYARVERFSTTSHWITFTKPVAREKCEIGKPARISWESSNLGGNVKIELSADDGRTWRTLSHFVSLNQGYFDFTPEATDFSEYARIQITSKINPDVSGLSPAFLILKPAKTYLAEHVDTSLNPITIDGIPDESVWGALAVDSLLSGGVPENWFDPWTHFTDNLVTWRAFWSANRLYLAVVVQDDRRGTPDNSDWHETPFYAFNDETLELHFDGDFSGGDFSGRYDTAQKWFVTPENVKYLDRYSTNNAPYTGSAINSAVKTGENGNWTFEGEFIIYNTFDSTEKTLAAGDTIGWDIWYNDSDDESMLDGKFTRDHQTGWYYSGRAYYFADCFGQLVLGGNSMPVELTSFEAKFNSGSVVLNWVTRSETNNYGFEIQRSTDNRQFAPIGFTQGNGTGAQQMNYEFTDNQPPVGTCFYRLKQIDLNGEFGYSPVVSVEVLLPKKLELYPNYPNPFNPETVFNFDLPASEKISLQIYNITGQVVATLLDQNLPAGQHSVRWNAENLPSGIYLMKLITRHHVRTRKIILVK